jgi:hypothetical protein
MTDRPAHGNRARVVWRFDDTPLSRGVKNPDGQEGDTRRLIRCRLYRATSGGGAASRPAAAGRGTLRAPPPVHSHREPRTFPGCALRLRVVFRLSFAVRSFHVPLPFHPTFVSALTPARPRSSPTRTFDLNTIQCKHWHCHMLTLVVMTGRPECSAAPRLVVKVAARGREIGTSWAQ